MTILNKLAEITTHLVILPVAVAFNVRAIILTRAAAAK